MYMYHNVVNNNSVDWVDNDGEIFGGIIKRI